MKKKTASSDGFDTIDAVKETLILLNGKWKLPIITALVSGPRRFKDIERIVGGITPKVLSKELKELETKAFVKRTVYSTIPVLVTYELTAYSTTLIPVIQSLASWGINSRKPLKNKARGRN